MGPCPRSEVNRLDAAVSEYLKAHGRSPVLKLYKSTNRHALLYYYEPSSMKIRLEWLLVHVDKVTGEYIFEFEDVSMMHAMFLGADLVESNGTWIMNLKVPLGEDLQITQDEDGSGMIVVQMDSGPAVLDRLYVDLTNKSAVEVLAKGLSMEGRSVEDTRVVDLSAFPIE